MNRTIAYFLLAVCLAGLTSAGIKALRKKPPHTILVRDSDTDTLLNPLDLVTERDIEFLLPDTLVPQDDDTLTWYIQKQELTGLKDKSFQLNEQVREWKFSDTGRYEVRAYKDMKEVGFVPVHVHDGDRFDVQWGEIRRVEKGTAVEVRDNSSNVSSRNWTLTRTGYPEDTVRGDGRLFEWTPEDTGTYSLAIDVTTRSRKEHHDEQLITVVLPPPAPKPEKREVVKPVPVPPKPKPTPVPPKPIPADVGSMACFVTHGVTGPEFNVPIGEPARNEVEFRSGEIVFEVSPNHDCKFIGFDYFAMGETIPLEVTIECKSKDCIGTARTVKPVTGAYDAYKKVEVTFKSIMPVMNEKYMYRITIKVKAPGKLGFFPLTKGNKFRSPGGAAVTFLDMQSCVFNLRFTR